MLTIYYENTVFKHNQEQIKLYINSCSGKGLHWHVLYYPSPDCTPARNYAATLRPTWRTSVSHITVKCVPITVIHVKTFVKPCTVLMCKLI